MHEKGYLNWALQRAEKLKDRLLSGETPPERLQALADMKTQAIADEQALKRSEPEAFNQFVRDYVNQPTD